MNDLLSRDFNPKTKRLIKTKRHIESGRKKDKKKDKKDEANDEPRPLSEVLHDLYRSSDTEVDPMDLLKRLFNEQDQRVVTYFEDKGQLWCQPSRNYTAYRTDALARDLARHMLVRTSAVKPSDLFKSQSKSSITKIEHAFRDLFAKDSSEYLLPRDDLLELLFRLHACAEGQREGDGAELTLLTPYKFYAADEGWVLCESYRRQLTRMFCWSISAALGAFPDITLESLSVKNYPSSTDKTLFGLLTDLACGQKVPDEKHEVLQLLLKDLAEERPETHTWSLTPQQRTALERRQALRVATQENASQVYNILRNRQRGLDEKIIQRLFLTASDKGGTCTLDLGNHELLLHQILTKNLTSEEQLQLEDQFIRDDRPDFFALHFQITTPPKLLNALMHLHNNYFRFNTEDKTWSIISNPPAWDAFPDIKKVVHFSRLQVPCT
jgi:DNA-binding MarR family transcriptional regulator